MEILSNNFPPGDDFIFNSAAAFNKGGPVLCIYSLNINPTFQNVQLTTVGTNYIPTGDSWKMQDPRLIL